MAPITFILSFQMLAKSCGMKTFRRIARNLASQSKLFIQQNKSFAHVPKISMEDLLISLTSASGLKQAEIFELLKVAAAQQSNPSQALLDIASNINDILALRPSLWIKNSLGVLETADLKSCTFNLHRLL